MVLVFGKICKSYFYFARKLKVYLEEAPSRVLLYPESKSGKENPPLYIAYMGMLLVVVLVQHMETQPLTTHILLKLITFIASEI